MGSNAGSGQPSQFQCFRCRRAKGALFGTMSWSFHQERGGFTRVSLTGKIRPRRGRTSLGTMSREDRQYQCHDCGHVGWSRHSDLEKINN